MVRSTTGVAQGVVGAHGGLTSPVLGLWIKEGFLEEVAFKQKAKRLAVKE